MTMVRALLLLPAVLFCDNFCQAQLRRTTPPPAPKQPAAACDKPAEQLPEVRGLKLGMDVAAIRGRFPNFVAPEQDAEGYAEFDYDFTLERGAFESLGEVRKEPLDGIDRKGLARVALGLFDGKIVVLVVSYEASTNWRDAGEFLRAVAAPLGLPPADNWKAINNHSLEYRCSAYRILLTTRPLRGGSGIAFYRLGVEEEIERRKAAAAERRRKEFKP